MELAGATPPAKMHGKSLVPVLKGETPKLRDSFLIEYFSDKVFERMNKMGYQAVRNDRWKYIHYTDLAGMDELYDLQADPYEMKNLMDGPTAKTQWSLLQAEMQRLVAESK